jgi:hypothetical protein
MSYLSLPQINFKGKVYCNPSTGDNNDLANVFDVDTLQFTNPMTVIQGAKVVDPPNQQTFPYGGATSAPDCRTWLMGLLDTSGVQNEGSFGQQAHWNYYGDHATRLNDTFVTSVSPRAGVTVPANDPLLSAQVNLIGTPSPLQFDDPVIVDNDPYALITSQIFSYGVTVVGKDANGNPVTLISANPASRSYAYYINVQKNLDPNATGFQMVSAIFLLSIPKSANLVINTSVDSPALKDLAAAVDQGAGLQMRFIFYDALYAIEPQNLYAQFAAGQYTPNPYLGFNVGTIGVLAPGDLLSAPPGRKLNVQTPLDYTLQAPCGTSTSGPNSGKVLLGVTQVDLDMTSETANLDCISTFPECNKDTNTKYDFGDMTLDLLPTAGGRITLGTIPYDQTTYEANGGMVSIALNNHPQLAAIKAAAATGTLVIHSVTQNVDALSESPGLDIQTEDRAMYFDVQTLSDWSNPNEQPVAGTTQITISAFQKGVPVQDAVAVNLEYWMCAKDQINPSKPQVPVPSRYFSIAGAVQQPDTVYQNPPGIQGPVSVITDQVTIPANSNGQLTLTLTGIRPGTSLIRFVDPTIPQVTPNFCWDNTSYNCIRILPFDDYRATPDSSVDNWPFIYANFFNYFALLYPVMSHVIPWGPSDAPNNPDTVKQFASNMKTFTNPVNWDTTIYMPITRDLSAGKRALLYRWCALQGS